MTGQEFVWGFLQHVLPAKFQHIRYYSLLNKHSSRSIGYVRMLVWYYLRWCYVLASRAVADVPPQGGALICGLCSGELRLTAITDATGDIVYRASIRVPVLDFS